MSYILIVIIFGHMPLKVTFADYNACEAARTHIVASVQATKINSNVPPHTVLSSGCYGREAGK